MARRALSPASTATTRRTARHSTSTSTGRRSSTGPEAHGDAPVVAGKGLASGAGSGIPVSVLVGWPCVDRAREAQAVEIDRPSANLVGQLLVDLAVREDLAAPVALEMEPAEPVQILR